MAKANETSPATDTPWAAEPSGDGFYRVVNSKSVVLAQKCVKEAAELFADAPNLLDLLGRIDAHLRRPPWERDEEEGVALQKKLDEFDAKHDGKAA